WPRATRGGTQLADDRLDTQRIFADHERAEIVDGPLQRGGNCARIKGHPDPFDAVIGAEPHDHDRPSGTRVFRGVAERIILRQHQDLPTDGLYFHEAPPGALTPLGTTLLVIPAEAGIYVRRGHRTSPV